MNASEWSRARMNAAIRDPKELRSGGIVIAGMHPRNAVPRERKITSQCPLLHGFSARSCSWWLHVPCLR